MSLRASVCVCARASGCPCVCLCTCVCIVMCVGISVRTRVCRPTYVRARVCMCVCMCLCVCVAVYLCPRVRVSACVHVIHDKYSCGNLHPLGGIGTTEWHKRANETKVWTPRSQWRTIVNGFLNVVA